MSGPLAGIKVLEMANVISGPYCGMLLADFGAEVVKVEIPSGGDPFRAWDAQEGAIRPPFAAYNRGKKSVTLNIQTESGRAIYRQLALQSDVILENFRPGALDRYGIGYDALKEENPGLVYCSISGMGSSGPYKDRPTYDQIAQAMSGLWSQLTDMADPEPVGPPICDQLTGLYAAYGILGGLVSRSLRGGQGQKLEISMLAAGVAFSPAAIAGYLMEGDVADKTSRAHGSQSYAFAGSDGLPFAIHLSSPQKFWRGLCETVGHPELIEDPRFHPKINRIANYDSLHDILQGYFSTRTRSEWLAHLEKNDVPAGPIYNVPEMLADPQVQHNRLVRTFGEGQRAADLLGFPVAYLATPSEPGLPPPLLGEHNQEIYRDRLSYSEEQFLNLKTEGAI